MFVVQATKKLLARLGPTTPGAPEESTGVLGSWHATALFWRPQVALFVNDRTLLPVLTPLAPAATLLVRFPDALADLLAAHHVPDTVIAAEVDHMRQHRLSPTTNRSVVGSMNEFAHLATPTATLPSHPISSRCPCDSRRSPVVRCSGGTSVPTESSQPCSCPLPRPEGPLCPTGDPRCGA